MVLSLELGRPLPTDDELYAALARQEARKASSAQGGASASGQVISGSQVVVGGASVVSVNGLSGAVALAQTAPLTLTVAGQTITLGLGANSITSAYLANAAVGISQLAAAAPTGASYLHTDGAGNLGWANPTLPTIATTTGILKGDGAGNAVPAVPGTDFVATSDARLTNARTPTAHAATHAVGGSDALTPGAVGAEPALGNPTASGYALTSTTGGARSWVALATGFTPGAVVAPSSVAGWITGYSGSAAVIDFQAAYTADIAGQSSSQRWQYSVDSTNWKGDGRNQ